MKEKYNHHGIDVWVDPSLKGKHREHCLCWSCKKFTPDDRMLNCKIANLLFSICQLESLVTPVYECPIYEEKI
jgi:hypothetical protein